MTDPRAAPQPIPEPSGNVPAPVRAHNTPIGDTVRVRSADLFRGALELQIEHHGAVYRLKQTSLGKLILTK